MKFIKMLAAAVVTAAIAIPATTATALDGPVVTGSTGASCAAIASDPLSVTVIGDSLTVLSIESIKAEFKAANRPLCFNAQSGRRSDQAVSTISGMKSAGQLGKTVVLALGTNDTQLTNPYLNKTYKSLLGYTYPRPTTFAIGWRGTDPYNAGRVQMLMTEWDNAIDRVYSVRWGDVAKAHPEYLTSDGIHPNATGQKAYAQTLLAAANKASSAELKKLALTRKR